MVTIVTRLQEQMQFIINDLWSIQLSIIGISVSIMALLFASYIGKVEAYRHINKSEEINKKLLSIYLLKGIKTFEQLNGKIKRVFICACSLFAYSCVVKYISCIDILFWMGLADLIFTITLIVGTFYIVMSVVNLYRETVK